MPDTVNKALVEAVEARDALIARLAADLSAARSDASAASTRLANLTNHSEGSYTMRWDRDYTGHNPARVSRDELDRVLGGK